jgi:hypothetical protein
MNTVFVQFINYRYSYQYAAACLGNGFSTALEYCKDKGDVVWSKSITYVEGAKTSDIDLVEPPIKKGRMYVSCLYMVHLYQAYMWANEYPNLKVICGGPVIGNFTYDPNAIPKNLTFESRTIEEVFGYKPFTTKWQLDVPFDMIPPLMTKLYFSYEIEEHCYHGKCIFCNYFNSKDHRIKKDLSFNDLKHNPFPKNFEKLVWLHSPSIKPNFLQREIFNLPKENFQYTIFLRSEPIINKTLEKILKTRRDEFPNVVFFLGIDFLGNRMLNYMNKGYTVDDIMETLRIIREYNLKATISSIVRWPIFTEEDVQEVEKYVLYEEIQKCISTWCINDLIVKPGTLLEKDKKFQGQPMLMGPLFMSWYPRLTKKQQQLNTRIKEAMIQNISGIIHRQDRFINQPYSY